MSKSDDLTNYWAKMSDYLRGKIDEKIRNHINENDLIESYRKAVITAGLSKSDLTTDEVTALHGFWLLWYDDARNEFCFPEELVDKKEPIIFGKSIMGNDASKKITIWKKGAKERFIKTAVEKGYNLESGAGSAGLGVRINKGICLRDTIRDTRGSVAYEDLLSSNYSFMGIPIYREIISNNSDKRSADDGKPIVLFCFFFPARGAWHDDSKSCCASTEKLGSCLYNVINSFCDKEVQPIVKTIYELLELRAYQEKVNNLSKLNMRGEFRKEVLKNFIASSSSRGGKKNRDLLGFKTALLLEKDSGNNGILTSNMFEDLAELNSYHLETNFNVLSNVDVLNHIKDQWSDVNEKVILENMIPLGKDEGQIEVSIQYFGSNTFQNDTFSWFCDQYSELLRVPRPWPKYPSDSTDLIDQKIDNAIEKIKWQELVLGKICQAIVDFMTGSKKFAEDIKLLLEIHNIEVPEVPTSSTNIAKIAFATTDELWKVDVSAIKDERLLYEIDTMSHTRVTIFRLLTALEIAKHLPEINTTLTILTNSGHDSHDYIKSEATISGGSIIIDCGSLTALGYNELLCSCSSNVDPLQKMSKVEIKEELGSYLITIGSNQFKVTKTNKDSTDNKRIGLGFAKKIETAETNNSKVTAEPRSLEDKDLPRIFYKQCYDLFKGNKSNNNSHSNPLPCLSEIAGNWSATWANHEYTADIIEQFKSLIKQEDVKSELKSIHIEALKVGVNSYIISPLWIDGRLHGLLLLGSPKREYDTAKRIRYSEQQLNAVQIICDYLRLAISLENKSKQAAEERAGADQVRHLAGIEPEIRKLIDDVNQMKRAAERVARKISPAQQGIFAYDSDTIKLFRTQGHFTVFFDIISGTNTENKLTIWNRVLGRNVYIQSEERQVPDSFIGKIAELIEAVEPRWDTNLSLQIKEGSWATPGGFPLETFHNPSDFTEHKIWNESYGPMFILLGLARANELMIEFGKVKFETGQVDIAIKSERLFSAAKLLFHKLHVPGNALNLVHTTQLMAALSPIPNRNCSPLFVHFNGERQVKINYYNELVDFVMECDKLDRYWSISGNVNVFINALHQLSFELSAIPKTEKEKKERIVLSGVSISLSDNDCTIKLTCTGCGDVYFDEKKLHRSELIDQEKNIPSEHGLTRAVVDLENCLKAFLKKDSLDAFGFSVTEFQETTDTVFNIVLKSGELNG